MFKYKRKAEKLDTYKIPSTTNYKYKMDMGEWNFPIHESVLDELQNFRNLYMYGVVDDEFNNLLDLIKKYNCINNKNDNVLLTNGSDNALRIILELFATKESKILIPTPTYVHFEFMLNTFEVKEINKPYIDYKMSNDEVTNFIFNELKNNYDLCYLVNPSMPIGHYINFDNIKQMLSLYPNTVFIFDEAYIEFSKNNSCASLIEEYNNLIVVRTFSKFFGLASLRLGYLMTNSNFIQLFKPYYNYKDITKISVKCATQSLINIDFYNTNKKLYFDLRNFIIINMKEIITTSNKIYDYIMNDGQYFTIICKDANDLKKYFDSHDIAVRNKNDDIKGAVRLTINKKEILEIVFDILKKY